MTTVTEKYILFLLLILFHHTIMPAILVTTTDLSLCDTRPLDPYFKFQVMNGDLNGLHKRLNEGAQADDAPLPWPDMDWNDYILLMKRCTQGRTFDYAAGKTSLGLACERGYTSIIRLLLASGASVKPSHQQFARFRTESRYTLMPNYTPYELALLNDQVKALKGWDEIFFRPGCFGAVLYRSAIFKSQHLPYLVSKAYEHGGGLHVRHCLLMEPPFPPVTSEHRTQIIAAIRTLWTESFLNTDPYSHIPRELSVLMLDFVFPSSEQVSHEDLLECVTASDD